MQERAVTVEHSRWLTVLQTSSNSVLHCCSNSVRHCSSYSRSDTVLMMSRQEVSGTVSHCSSVVVTHSCLVSNSVRHSFSNVVEHCLTKFNYDESIFNEKLDLPVVTSVALLLQQGVALPVGDGLALLHLLDVGDGFKLVEALVLRLEAALLFLLGGALLPGGGHGRALPLRDEVGLRDLGVSADLSRHLSAHRLPLRHVAALGRAKKEEQESGNSLHAEAD